MHSEGARSPGRLGSHGKVVSHSVTDQVIKNNQIEAVTHFHSNALCIQMTVLPGTLCDDITRKLVISLRV